MFCLRSADEIITAKFTGKSVKKLGLFFI